MKLPFGVCFVEVHAIPSTESVFSSADDPRWLGRACNSHGGAREACSVKYYTQAWNEPTFIWLSGPEEITGGNIRKFLVAWGVVSCLCLKIFIKIFEYRTLHALSNRYFHFRGRRHWILMTLITQDSLIISNGISLGDRVTSTLYKLFLQWAEISDQKNPYYHCGACTSQIMGEGVCTKGFGVFMALGPKS